MSNTEHDLIEICRALITDYSDLSDPEKKLLDARPQNSIEKIIVDAYREEILAGNDPLGELFSLIRSSSERRSTGAVYTPYPIIRSMMTWLSNQPMPSRIVDPGAGSGRFIISAGNSFPDANLVAIEMDPLAALMLRANICVHGWTQRTTIIVDDYRAIDLDPCDGITAFIGNPPYVRHHDIQKSWKTWYSSCFKSFGIKASALAGLHLHFFLKTRLLAREGDIGAFVTSAEWLDVNYGSALRQLILEELGGIALHVLEPDVEAFPGTATTAAITCFRIGENNQPLRLRSVEQLTELNGLTAGVDVTREELRTSARWSIIIRPPNQIALGDIEIGEIFSVHRGQVTGANDIWIAGEQAKKLPESVKVASITKAKELILAGSRLDSAEKLRCVIDLPVDLDEFTREERRRIDRFLKWAEREGGRKSYTAQNRKAWWSVGLRAPAPILCTYMARRPPQFTLNNCNARHINIAHGLYPREPIPSETMDRLVSWLNKNIHTGDGRTYAGGLAKFEPKEIERFRI